MIFKPGKEIIQTEIGIISPPSFKIIGNNQKHFLKDICLLEAKNSYMVYTAATLALFDIWWMGGWINLK